MLIFGGVCLLVLEIKEPFICGKNKAHLIGDFFVGNMGISMALVNQQ